MPSRKSLTRSKPTAKEKAWFVAWMKSMDKASLEAECRKLLGLRKQGKLLSFKTVLEDLGVLPRKKTKKPA